MTGFSRGIIAAAFGLLWMTTPGLASERIIVILDASGSMWGQIDGKPKQEIARQSLRTALESVPDDAKIGFMAFGHRQKDSCQDIELIVPPATGTSGAINAAMDKLKFQGKTPLTDAVKQAAKALGSSTKSPARIVLITDGVESCKGDPCALGRKLKEGGEGPVVDIVGFGLDADEGRQVACLADATGGKYIQATDAQGLKQALAETVTVPIAAAKTLSAAEQKPAPEAEDATEKPQETAPSAEAAVTEPAVKDADFVPTVALSQGGEPVSDGNSWQIYKALPDGSRGDLVTSQHGAYSGALAPGNYIVVARLGEASAEQQLTFKAGETYKPVFVLDAGVLDITAPDAFRVEIVSTQKDAGGNRKTLAASYGETLEATLPAGDYLVVASHADGSTRELSASVKAGERQALKVK